MSKTDKTRPWWVQMNDVPGGRRAKDGCDRTRHLWAPYTCDLPDFPHPHTNTACTWEPAHAFIDERKMFSDSRYRKSARRRRYRADRTAQRAIARALTRDANSDGEIDEDVIDNRVAGPYALYGRGRRG